eukprot:gnl/MRDRNA2_/MRDRNA2_207357_c0_seq1.p1 gnl/MRDRNA2_/MRDRNA2_207357_c0~~gnl/MRDRNA2_/MRDRNA2_207357_c0_seq1.p1  ORF type:complete len:184 (+),score=35.52 gnl/MRDRNA2_/MRDRNA2_207357_c0_seq1:73-624(+)
MKQNEMRLVCILIFLKTAECESAENAEPLEKLCRFCFEEEGSMVAPCACTGSIKWVHPKCLQLWQRTAYSERRAHVEVCSVCKGRYHYQVVPALIDILRNDNEEVQAEAAVDLVNLALSSHNQTVILEVMQALNEVVNDGTLEARNNAAAALKDIELVQCIGPEISKRMNFRKTGASAQMLFE